MIDKIAVLDFGGQYAHLIANRVRRLGVYCEILEPDTPLEKLAEYKGFIFSGGPRSVYEKNAPTTDPKIFILDVPVLGICYGHQLVAHLLNGKVKPGKIKEYGLANLKIKKSEGIFQGLKNKTQVWMSHGDSVSKLPTGFSVFGETNDCKFAAYGNTERNIYGVQFHVEVTHTPEGMKMLSNFLDLCKCKREWNMARFLQQELDDVKQRLGDERKVFMLVSGGVDSTVAFALLNKALGDKRVYGLFVDTGFLRKNEGVKVNGALRALGFKNFHMVNAKEIFIKALKGFADPEEKRKIIGNTFLEVQRQEVKRLKLDPNHWLLGQGTIYPDTIETGGTKHAARIKTHHNRVPEIEALMKKGLVIEPLKNLYKDEVREVGEKLGLPKEMVWRHPFPGPGLAVRILCAKKSYPLPQKEKIEKEIEKFSNLHAQIPAIRSVGVQGDDRTYRHPLVLFHAGNNFEKLEKLSTSLTNRFREINRVLISLHPEKPVSFSVHESFLTKDRIRLLQSADDIVMKFIQKHHLERDIWQFPVVLLPLSPNGKKGETVVLRPVVSQEAMTANFYKMDFRLLSLLTKKLQKIPGISAVLYDITNKPPGTIEWE